MEKVWHHNELPSRGLAIKTLTPGKEGVHQSGNEETNEGNPDGAGKLHRGGWCFCP